MKNGSYFPNHGALVWNQLSDFLENWFDNWFSYYLTEDALGLFYDTGVK